MGPVSAISVLILGIVVPALAGYIEVSQTTFPIFFPSQIKPSTARGVDEDYFGLVLLFTHSFYFM